MQQTGRRAKRVLWWAFATLAAACPIARAQREQAPASHVYILDCAGTLHILQEGAKAPEAVLDLAAKTRLILRSNNTGGVVSGCAASSATYLAGTHELAVLAQTSGDPDENGRFGYRVLHFHVPDLRFAGAVAVPGKYEDPPRLALNPEGNLRMVAGDSNLSWMGTGWVASSPATAQDGLPAAQDGWATLPLNGYKILGSAPLPPLEQISVRRLQYSGNAVLAEAIASGTSRALCVIWPRGRKLVWLPATIVEPELRVQLAPGGRAVLLPSALPGGSADVKGAMVLIRGDDGTALRTLQDPLLLRWGSAGITPTGSVVLFDGTHYHLRSLGLSFTNAAVFDSSATDRPRAVVAP